MTDKALRLFVLFAIGFILAWFFGSVSHSATPNQFVQMFELHYGYPGSTRVLPDCSCTIRYLGTTVHGRVYDIRLEKMD